MSSPVNSRRRWLADTQKMFDVCLPGHALNDGNLAASTAIRVYPDIPRNIIKALVPGEHHIGRARPDAVSAIYWQSRVAIQDLARRSPVIDIVIPTGSGVCAANIFHLLAAIQKSIRLECAGFRYRFILYFTGPAEDRWKSIQKEYVNAFTSKAGPVSYDSKGNFTLSDEHLKCLEDSVDDISTHYMGDKVPGDPFPKTFNYSKPYPYDLLEKLKVPPYLDKMYESKAYAHYMHEREAMGFENPFVFFECGCKQPWGKLIA
jgi:hypothetical protein